MPGNHWKCQQCKLVFTSFDELIVHRYVMILGHVCLKNQIFNYVLKERTFFWKNFYMELQLCNILQRHFEMLSPDI